MKINDFKRRCSICWPIDRWVSVRPHRLQLFNSLRHLYAPSSGKMSVSLQTKELLTGVLKQACCVLFFFFFRGFSRGILTQNADEYETLTGADHPTQERRNSAKRDSLVTSLKVDKLRAEWTNAEWSLCLCTSIHMSNASLVHVYWFVSIRIYYHFSKVMIRFELRFGSSTTRNNSHGRNHIGAERQCRETGDLQKRKRVCRGVFLRMLIAS